MTMGSKGNMGSKGSKAISQSASGDQTRVLNGEAGVTDHDSVMRVIESELRRLVYGRLRRVGQRRGHGVDLTLTCVVQDVWVKLGRSGPWDNRAHFYGSASRAARQLIVDWLKRHAGQGPRFQPLGETDLPDRSTIDPRSQRRIETVNEFIEHLRSVNERWAQVVEMRIFGGLSTAIIAEALGVSERTVERDWLFAAKRLEERLGEQLGEHPGEHPGGSG